MFEVADFQIHVKDSLQVLVRNDKRFVQSESSIFFLQLPKQLINENPQNETEWLEAVNVQSCYSRFRHYMRALAYKKRENNLPSSFEISKFFEMICAVEFLA